MTAFGIDFGTGYLRAATLAGGTPRPVCDVDGSDAIPAVVVFEKSGVRVGRAALARAAMSPQCALRSIKRWLGRAPSDDFVGPDAQRAVEGFDGKLELRVGDTSVGPEDVAARLVAHIVDLAEASSGIRPTSVVLTAPPWLESSGRAALAGAATQVGLTVSRILAEATAASVTLPELRRPGEHLFLVVDGGAGGVSASVVLVGAGKVVLVATAGDDRVGGDEIDYALVEHGTRAVASLLPGGSSGAVVELLRQTFESIKRDLSQIHTASANLPFLGAAGDVTFDRAHLDPLLTPFLDRLDAVCAQALQEASLSLGEIDAIYATGGMTNVPGVRARLERALRRAPAALPHGPGSIAAGAALLAGALTGEVPAVSVVEMAHATLRPPAPATLWPPPRRSTAPPSFPVTVPPAPARPMRVSVPLPQRSASTLPGPPTRPSMPASSRPPPPATASSRPPPMARTPTPAVPRTPTPRPPTIPPPAAPPRVAMPPPAPPSPPVAPVAPVAVPRRGSQPPGTLGVSLPRDVGSGHFVCPADVAALLRLPLMHPPTAADLSPVTLPVLLVRLLGREHVTGKLTLENAGRVVEIDVIDGRACVSGAEHKWITHAFAWPDGEYRFEAKDIERGARATMSMVRLTVDGLRVLARTFTADQMEAALGDRLDLAPVLRPERTHFVSRFGLAAAERRVLERGLDGITTGYDLEREGLGKHGGLALLVLLILFEAVDWHTPKSVERESLSDQLERRATKMADANHFDALGVHWSAHGEAIDAAYQALRHELAPDGERARAAPDACRRMRERAAEAYAVLGNPRARIAYRRKAFPLDYEALANLMEHRAEAASMRQSDSEARSDRSVADELARTHRRGERADAPSEPGPRTKPPGRDDGK